MQRIVIVGSGVVGTATGIGFVRRGHEVEFVDIDPRRVDDLRSEGFAASDVVDLSGDPAFVFLVLPTPNRGNCYDLSAYRDGVCSVAEALRDATEMHTVVSRSTVPPGTCDEVVLPVLEHGSGLRSGSDFQVASNPEFLRASCALEDFLNPWMTVVASRSKRTSERLRSVYEPFGGDMRVFSNPAVAEMIKCVHNVFNATKISFWNEVWEVAHRLELDPHDVATTVVRSAEGSFNVEYGTRGGEPYGGACLPKDTRGFLGFARERGMHLPLLEATIAVNERMGEPVDEPMPSRLDLTTAAAS